MTENEAIKALGQGDKNSYEAEVSYEEYLEAIEMGRKALEELQAYRAIGTVEGYERAIKSSIENYNLYREYKAKVQSFEAIGTVEDFKELKEKNEPKKPISISEIDNIGNAMVECPICHARSDYDTKSIKNGHCWRCGQSLDWRN